MRLQTADSSFLSLLLFLCAVCLSLLPLNSEAANLKQVVTISDQKEWKKLLKTRTNVLALFTSGEKHVASLLPTFDSVADRIRGKGTLVYVDCTTKDGKKFCKNLKIKANPYVLKHYKDGKFNKDYDRLLNEKSMYSFMENPTADPPWSEDSTASNVRHIEGPSDFERLLAKEKRPILVFFYAPWCGHCKRMKPEFAEAATEVKGRFVLAGMDVDSPDAYGIRQEFNITGFPTIVYFEKGKKKFDYGGGRDKDGILEWLKDPKPPAEAPPTQEEQPWSEVKSDVVHLTSDTFDPFVAENPSVLVMFYAPWCGHCKAMKPDYTQAAKMMKDAGVHGVLAAVDATKEAELGKKYDVKGFPTIKYFGEGEMKYEYGYGRSAPDIVDFMTEPRAPPPPEKDWAEIESEVHHLTDEEFKPFLKKKRNVLVMFYAPWCGHCKAAKPEYQRAAEHFKEDKKTVLAALDCTKFQSICEQNEVTGFPTFKYFNYGKKSAHYGGPRNEEGFIEVMSNPTLFFRDEL